MHPNLAFPHEHADSEAQLYRQVGQRIKTRRKLLRMTQGQLAQLLNVTYQQVQKYEAGLNHMPLARLLKLAALLHVSPDYFYDGVTLEDAIGQEITIDILPRPRTRPLQVVIIAVNPAEALLLKAAAENFAQDITCHCITDAHKVMDYLQHYFLRYGHPPDLILVDLQMPRMSGMQLLKEMKADARTASIPVLVLARSLTKAQMQEAQRSGATSVIRKPPQEEEYRAVLEAVMRYWLKALILPG